MARGRQLGDACPGEVLLSAGELAAEQPQVPQPLVQLRKAAQEFGWGGTGRCQLLPGNGIVGQCLRQRTTGGGPLTGKKRVAGGATMVACAGEVPGEVGCDLGRCCRMARQQCLPHAGMEERPPGSRDMLVDRLGDERVREAVADRVPGVQVLRQQLRAPRHVEGREQAVLTQIAELAEQQIVCLFA